MGRVKEELWDGRPLGDDTFDYADFSEQETRELEQWLDFQDEHIQRTEQTFRDREDSLESGIGDKR